MELKTAMKNIRTMETLYDDFKESSVDCDFMLPDYLPDIAAILKCVMKPVVQSYQAVGDRVTADGMVSLQILYLDEDRKCVRSFETSQSFNCTFTVKDMESNDSILFSAKTNYVNCRATSPRRVDVHGAFNVKLTVCGNREKEILGSIDCEDLYTKDSAMNFSRRIGFEEKNFTVNEVVELENAQGAEMLLRVDALPRITDCKILSGKAIVKGEILLKTVYATDTVAGTLDFSDNILLFSQIVDMEGLNEECQYSCRVSLKYCEAHPAQNPGGENKLLSFTGKLTICLQGFCRETVSVICDAYHARLPLQTTRKPLELRTITGICQDSQALDFSIEIPDEEVISVVDLWCDMSGTVTANHDTEKLADAQVLVCMLVKDSRNCIAYYERPSVSQISLPENYCDTTVEVSATKVEWSFADKKVNVRLYVDLQGECLCREEREVIADISMDGSQPYLIDENEADCCMKVYFAGPGESLWDIAKQQHVSPEKLYEENGGEDTVLQEDRLLLFPLK